MGIKIYLRVDRRTLTHARTVFGMSISYDELADAFRRCGVDCVQEFPTGNNTDAVRCEPENVEEYIEMWQYGVMLDYALPDKCIGRGRIGYVRGVSSKLEGVELENLKVCDLVLFASTVAADFHSSYLTMPVGVLPGGYNPLHFYPVERDFHADPFVFLHAGATDRRKGSDVVCQAFTEAFPLDTRVSLVVQSPGETAIFASLKETYKSDPRIVFKIDPVSDRSQMLERYYSTAHCLVYPSVAEGYGRMLPEAMATGMPAIVSGWSAPTDHFNSDCGWWLEKSIISSGFHSAVVSDVAEKMAMVYSNRDACADKGRFAAKFAKRVCVWEVGVGAALPAIYALWSR